MGYMVRYLETIEKYAKERAKETEKGTTVNPFYASNLIGASVRKAIRGKNSHSVVAKRYSGKGRRTTSGQGSVQAGNGRKE